MKGYSGAFQSFDSTQKYAEVVYGRESYDSFIWTIQKKRLLAIFEGLNEIHEGGLVHFDFACGTGRIISAVETLTTKSTGIDISSIMLTIARKNVKCADLRQGDILEDPNVVGFNYDVITAFRFFLNAEPELRTSIMKVLSLRLRSSKSRLIFNIQGNSRSFRHLSIAYRAKRGECHNEMSYKDVCTLVEGAGLEIESWYGFGICPRLLFRTILRPLMRVIDRFAVRLPFLKSVSYDLLFVCKPKA